MSTAVMTEPIAEAPQLSTANIAGAFYLASILTAGAAAFVRWRLTGDAAATATNILAHQQLFWMVLAADLISILCYVAVTLLFYEMYKPVSKRLSFLAASSDQKIIIPWRVIDGPESADAVAAEIMKTPIRRASRTSISGAINFAMRRWRRASPSTACRSW